MASKLDKIKGIAPVDTEKKKVIREDAVDISFSDIMDNTSYPVMDEDDIECAKYPFMFLSHPSSWQIMDGKIVPYLREARLIPGVNCVLSAKAANGFPSGKELRREAEDMGWVLIDNKLGPSGSYLSRKTVKGKRTRAQQDIYCSAFTKLYQSSDVITINEKAYAKWLSSLVSAGHIPEISVAALTKIKEKYLKELNSKYKKSEARIEILKNYLKICDEKMAYLEEAGLVDNQNYDDNFDNIFGDE